MLTKHLLSILIPTFNRDKYLDRLLCELSRQMKESGVSEMVEVIIADNASSDNTQSIIDSYLPGNKNFSCIRHSSNLGVDCNLVSLLERASSKFMWFIGDDDLPVADLLRNVIKQLHAMSPSLLYLPSVWAPDISSIVVDQSKELLFTQRSSLQTAKDIHIWTTFVSSWVFNADEAFSSPSVLPQVLSLKGSNLPQLGWILPLLAHPQSQILVANRPCILATSGNSGGYSVLRTFMINYPAIVNICTKNSSRVRSALIGNSLKSHLPGLIICLRRGQGFREAGDSEGIFLESLKLLWSYPYYWIFCVPAFFVPLGLIGILGFVFRRLMRSVKNLHLPSKTNGSVAR